MIISWNTTNACNMFCDHCYRDAGCKADEELNTQEAKTLLEQIAKAGFKIMIFSGGEPLMRPDIVELVEYATKLGLRSVFGTNGTLITEEMALKLKNAGSGRRLRSPEPRLSSDRALNPCEKTKRRLPHGTKLHHTDGRRPPRHPHPRAGDRRPEGADAP